MCCSARFRLLAFVAVLGLLASACRGGSTVFDFDGDGVPDDSDCDPQDGSIWAGAFDPFGDGVDQDCDGADGTDADGDGYPSSAGGGPDCSDSDAALNPADLDGDGASTCAGDCDDADPLRAPGRPEVCDGLDSDCDGVVPADEQDADGDGVSACLGDCAPQDPAVFPSAPELCDTLDTDCDGDLVDGALDTDFDGSPDCIDADDDGDGVDDEQDCAPDNPAIHPGAEEACDGVDSDCDGDLSDGFEDTDSDALPDCIDPDDDGDGEPDETDCGPLDASVHPGAAEVCDALDSDCDGDLVEGDLDFEGDGIPDCADPDDDGDGDPDTTDCAPFAASIFTGATEACEGLDTDCDGVVPAIELDGDGDGLVGCAGDCNDANPAVFTGAPEQCNGLDDNCDGLVPSGEFDTDLDSFAPCQGDCNDLVPTMYPGASEICDGYVQDCGQPLPPEEADGDGDGLAACLGDCDDTDGSVFPGNGAWDTPGDGIDANCDGRDHNDLGTFDAAADGGTDIVNAGNSCLVGDVDGDGVNEVLVGAFGLSVNGSESGGAYLISGADLGTPGVTNLSTDALFTVYGEAPGALAGVVAPAGDVDGDGLDDFLVGAPFTVFGGVPAGRAYLVLGSQVVAGGSMELTSASAIIQQPGGDYLGLMGWGIAPVGDLDNDGKDDIAVSAPSSDAPGFDTGRVGIFFGADLEMGGTFALSAAPIQFVGTQLEQRLGFSVTAVPDIDGDGVAELAASSTYFDGPGGQDSGVTYVWLSTVYLAGGVFGPGAAQITLHGEGLWDQSGESIVGLNDLDGDGLGELVVGAPQASVGVPLGAGRVYVVLGSTIAAGGTLSLGNADVVIDGVEPSAGAGFLSAPGDLDGDGSSELLIGAPYSSEGGIEAGKAYVFRGATLLSAASLSLEDADAAFTAEAAADILGTIQCKGPLGGAGADFNGDGRDDLVLGAQVHSGSAVLDGRTYVLYSPW